MTRDLEPRALRAFCSIADYGSLTRAAAALGVDQSVLSRRLASLEEAIGSRLVHRTARGAVLTDLGRRLEPRARGLLADAEGLLQEARGEQASPVGAVELAVVPAVSCPLVSALVARLRTDHPRVRLRAVEAYSGQVEESLAAGRADLGLFNRYRRTSVRGAELLLQAEIVLVGARRRPFERRSEIALRDVAHLPLVLPPRPNALVATLADLAARQRVELDLALEATSPSLIRDAVEHAGLWTLVPRHLAEREYAGASFARLRVVWPAIRQRTWLAFTTQRPPSAAARLVGDLVRELLPPLAET